MAGLQDKLSVLPLFERMQRLPRGRQLFTRIFQRFAPYFRTIPATVESLEPGRASVSMRDTRAVHNHLGTVHAIALCNLAEMVMGLVAEATVPRSHRWIPKGMQVEYLAKARGRMHAHAALDAPAAWPDGETLTVPVNVHDPDGQLVFRAHIDIWITQRG